MKKIILALIAFIITDCLLENFLYDKKYISEKIPIKSNTTYAEYVSDSINTKNGGYMVHFYRSDPPRMIEVNVKKIIQAARENDCDSLRKLILKAFGEQP